MDYTLIFEFFIILVRKILVAYLEACLYRSIVFDLLVLCKLIILLYMHISLIIYMTFISINKFLVFVRLLHYFNTNKMIVLSHIKKRKKGVNL